MYYTQPFEDSNNIFPEEDPFEQFFSDKYDNSSTQISNSSYHQDQQIYDSIQDDIKFDNFQEENFKLDNKCQFQSNFDSNNLKQQNFLQKNFSQSSFMNNDYNNQNNNIELNQNYEFQNNDQQQYYQFENNNLNNNLNNNEQFIIQNTIQDVKYQTYVPQINTFNIDKQPFEQKQQEQYVGTQASQVNSNQNQNQKKQQNGKKIQNFSKKQIKQQKQNNLSEQQQQPQKKKNKNSQRKNLWKNMAKIFLNTLQYETEFIQEIIQANGYENEDKILHQIKLVKKKDIANKKQYINFFFLDKLNKRKNFTEVTKNVHQILRILMYKFIRQDVLRSVLHNSRVKNWEIFIQQRHYLYQELMNYDPYL